MSMKDKLHVKVPIRYGRLSEKNNEKQYTMVFSQSCDNNNHFGTAYIIPFKRNSIRSLRGLENQARFLSEAEGARDRKLCIGKSKWCTIGILFNPNIEPEIKKQILNKWKQLVLKDGGLADFQDYKICDEETVLSDHGEILINWPNAVDERDQDGIDNFDVIIATCTKPTLENYLSIDELRMKAQNDKRGYFYQNIKNGITTFEDRLILKH